MIVGPPTGPGTLRTDEQRGQRACLHATTLPLGEGHDGIIVPGGARLAAAAEVAGVVAGGAGGGRISCPHGQRNTGALGGGISNLLQRQQATVVAGGSAGGGP